MTGAETPRLALDIVDCHTYITAVELRMAVDMRVLFFLRNGLSLRSKSPAWGALFTFYYIHGEELHFTFSAMQFSTKSGNYVEKITAHDIKDPILFGLGLDRWQPHALFSPHLLRRLSVMSFR